MITAGATIIGIGLTTIGVAILERNIYKQGKEELGHLINITTKTVLIIGAFIGIGIMLFHAVGRLL